MKWNYIPFHMLMLRNISTLVLTLSFHMHVVWNIKLHQGNHITCLRFFLISIVMDICDYSLVLCCTFECCYYYTYLSFFIITFHMNPIPPSDFAIGHSWVFKQRGFVCTSHQLLSNNDLQRWIAKETCDKSFQLDWVWEVHP